VSGLAIEVGAGLDGAAQRNVAMVSKACGWGLRAGDDAPCADRERVALAVACDFNEGEMIIGGRLTPGHPILVHLPLGYLGRRGFGQKLQIKCAVQVAKPPSVFNLHQPPPGDRAAAIDESVRSLAKDHRFCWT